MKPTFKDYLSIALALLAIFLCGYGIGFLFGERKGRSSVRPAPAPPAHTSSIAHWEEDVLAVIEKTIDLTPQQLDKVKAEIARSGARVRAAREGALDAYRLEMQTLNQRLAPHLTPEQRKKLQETPPNE